ncbi:hypothetical protein IJG20_03565 [Candidatus Saccharibacteria bacterium]|nr:hypothetical protein [Candidatus Saccharibacteria bacterium]
MTFVRLLLTVFFCGVTLAAYSEENQMALIDAIREGVNQQLREVEFKCTYSYSGYVVNTLEEAENYDTSNGRLVIHATGTLAKTKKMTYESLVVDKLETRVPEYLMDHVTVANAELRAVYRKQSLKHHYRTLFVLERDEKNKSLPILNQFEGVIPCPLTLGGSRSLPNFLDYSYSLLDFYSGRSDVTTEFAIENNKETTTISVHHEKPDPFSSVISDTLFTLSNLYPFPVLLEETQRDHFTHHQKNKVRDRLSVVKALDFSTLNNGCVLPKKIYTFSTIFFDDFKEEDIDKYLVTKWESDDMGKEKPKKSDFYIYLDRDSDIGGLALNLNDKLERDLPEYFDINQYGVRDLQASSPIESQVDRNADFTVLIRPAILLIAGFFIAYGIWKKWKSAKRSAAA